MWGPPSTTDPVLVVANDATRVRLPTDATCWRLGPLACRRHPRACLGLLGRGRRSCPPWSTAGGSACSRPRRASRPRREGGGVWIAGAGRGGRQQQRGRDGSERREESGSERRKTFYNPRIQTLPRFYLKSGFS